MKTSKKLVSLLSSIALLFTMIVSVSAAETGTVTVKTLNLMNSKDFVEQDVFTISNVIGQSTTIKHKYDINLQMDCPVYICTGDFAVTLLQDVKNYQAYGLYFKEKYEDASTGRVLENHYITSSPLKVEKTVGSTFTRPEEKKRPQDEEVYVVKGSTIGIGNYAAVIKVVDDNYTLSETDIPLSQISNVTAGGAELIPPAEVAPTPLPEKVTANPTTSKVYINQDSEGYYFDAYNIGGNNYFKLRDLAYRFTEVNGSWSPFFGFEVTWDGATNSIHITQGQSYTPVGGEMAKGDGTPKQGSLCKSSIYIDGNPVTLTAYNIGGNNYFKLRDLCKAFDISVTWDGETNSIYVLSQEGYTED